MHRQLGLPIASTAPLAKITDAFSAAMHRFARDQRVPWVDFVKGQRKDDVMHEHLAGFDRRGGGAVRRPGAGEDRAVPHREAPRRRPAAAYPWIVKSTGMVNHFYFYCRRRRLRPVLPEVLLLLPLQRQAVHQRPRVGQAPGRAGRDRVHRAGQRLRRLSPTRPRCRRSATGSARSRSTRCCASGWRSCRTRSPRRDRAAGYRYDLSILQAEFSLTQVLDRPVSGRVFFEQVIRENLDLGRPDQVSLVFDRRLKRSGPRPTPGRFRTRVITEGVTPSLHVDYKHATIKQYHKEGRALRTETTINDTRDFGIGKRLTNLPALREIGFSANRRLLGVQRLSHDPIRAAEAFTAVTDPIITVTGHRVAGLRFGDPRAHALLPALLVFRLFPNGFTNRDLRTLLAGCSARHPTRSSAGQMTYDLRRLRAHGLIARLPAHPPLPGHRPRAAPRHVPHPRPRPAAAPRPGPTRRPRPARAQPLRTAARTYQRALDDLTHEAGLAA